MKNTAKNIQPAKTYPKAYPMRAVIMGVQRAMKKLAPQLNACENAIALVLISKLKISLTKRGAIADHEQQNITIKRQVKTIIMYPESL